MNTTKGREIPKWKVGLNMIINPAGVIKNHMTKVPWPYSLFVSGLAFTLFFLQTGIDLFRNGDIEVLIVVLIGFLGLLYGTAGIALLAIMFWAFAQGSDRDIDMKWAISSFALGYASTLIYAFTGLFFSLVFAWKTAVAFGVTGLLWALRPTMATIKIMSGDRLAFSIVMTTLCGVILLIGWSLLSRFAG